MVSTVLHQIEGSVAFKQEVPMRKRLRLLILVALFALAIPNAALAAPGPGTNNCWGTVVSQRASYYHDIGTHSSSQSEPRLGVGNLAKLFGMSIGDLAALLSFLDNFTGDDPAGVTNCP
jgi:hypothetical protein